MERVPGAAPVDASNAPQLTEAQPMTDAEAVNCEALDAEAVLLGLGSTLEWHHEEDWWLGRDVHHIRMYMVYESKPNESGNASGYTAERRFGGQSISEIIYASVTAAKLACEHHHATGKWN